MKLLSSAALLMLVVLPAAAQNTRLVTNGKSAYAILLAPGATDPMRHGAEELQRFIKQMSGAELPILSPEAGVSDLPAGIRGLIILADDQMLAQREGRPALAEEEFTTKTRPASQKPSSGAKVLTGAQVPAIEIAGGGKRGTLYGCYAFLEDVLGCRWYNPRVSRIPKKRTITVPPLDIHQKPSFEYREPFYTEAFERDWAVRNRCNGNAQHLDESVGGKVSYGKFVHTFSELVPPEKYYKDHPEYFSMVNGKRMDGYAQLCLTNPDVLRISIERVEQWIKENPTATIFSVSQNDTGYNCQCDKCKAVEEEEGAPSGVVLRFVNAIADAIAKDHPNVLIDTLAYQWTEKPPKLVKPRPNVRIRVAPIGACVSHGLDKCDANKTALANLTAWNQITNQLYVWHYSTNFANYLQPLPDLDEIAVDIPLFKRTGVVGLFYEGDYAPGGGGEMSELKAYLMAKLMWDSERPAQPIIDEYINNVYGKAAPYIHQWINTLYAGCRTANVHAHIYEPPTAPYLSESILAAGSKLFDEAEKAADGDPVATDEVQRARLALEYVQLMRTKADDPHRAVLAKKVADKIHKYGIGQIREGEPVENFLKRIGQ